MRSDNDKNGVSTQMHLGEMKNVCSLGPIPPPAILSQHPIWKLKLKVRE